MNRRELILGSVALTTLGTGGWLARSLLATAPEGVLLSGFEDLPGNQYVGGAVLPEGHVFGRRVPARVHGHAVDPLQPARVLFFARRPGTEGFELDLTTLEVRTAFATPAGRHLAGHGLFSPDGAVLLTAEHDYAGTRGVLGIRDARDYRIVGEIDTHGLDPHEIAWLPDGKTLVVANGGILTHPRTYRRKLNIPTMDPSLVLIDAASGRMLEQLRLPDHRLSIRHLAVTVDGNVAVGLQYEGEPAAAPSIAALYRPGEGLQLLPLPGFARAGANGYVASIAVNEPEGWIAAACPYGKGVARWQTRTREFIDFVAAGEAYGVASSGSSLLASQRDGTVVELGAAAARPLSLDLSAKLRWDDHWSLRPRPAGFAPPSGLG